MRGNRRQGEEGPPAAPCPAPEQGEPEFLHLVKNLRGILYFEEGREREFEWLKRKFRYRELGVSELLDRPKGWAKLVVLPRLGRDPVLDTLLLANRYIAPVILLGESSLRPFRKIVVAELRTRQRLGDRELKFNLRLVDYAITDFYVKAVELAREGRMEERKRLAESDLRRFWRIKPDPKGSTFVGYLEPLGLRELKGLSLSLLPFLVLDLDRFGPLETKEE